MADPVNTVETELAKALVQAAIAGLAKLLRRVAALFGRGGKAEPEQPAADVEPPRQSIEVIGSNNTTNNAGGDSAQSSPGAARTAA
jgi:hypothetical protein